MIYELDVIEKNGISYFQHTHFGVSRRFEVISAFSEFEGGSLKVIRADNVWAETDSIRSVDGTKTTFSGIDNIFNEQSIAHYPDSLSAEALNTGDKVIIDAPNATQDGSFASYIKRQPELVLDI